VEDNGSPRATGILAMHRNLGFIIFSIVAVIGVLGALWLVDLRLAAVAGLVVALWMFARSAIALLK